MAKGIPLQTLKKLISKSNIGVAVAGKGLETVSALSKEKFGYDFLGLGIKLIIFYAVAFLIEWYMRGKIFVDEVIENPQSQTILLTGIFGIGGFIGDFIMKQFLQDKEQNPDKTFTTSAFFSNKYIRELFSDNGIKGFKYWDIIKIITLLLVIMEWKRFNDMTKASNGQVSPLTHGMFMLFIFAISLTIIPDLIKKLKTTDFNLESLK